MAINSSRMIYIQSQMTERAIQLLGIPSDSGPLRFLDIGCGSGLSGNTNTDANCPLNPKLVSSFWVCVCVCVCVCVGAVLTNLGHNWVGVDISPSMLGVARQREAEGDVICLDMGHGLPFRPGSFDGVIR
jgi:18S rRNA (guanine1575-N7)-methyltransferase